jgi:hypothetical protein
VGSVKQGQKRAAPKHPVKSKVQAEAAKKAKPNSAKAQVLGEAAKNVIPKAPNLPEIAQVQAEAEKKAKLNPSGQKNFMDSPKRMIEASANKPRSPMKDPPGATLTPTSAQAPMQAPGQASMLSPLPVAAAQRQVAAQAPTQATELASIPFSPLVANRKVAAKAPTQVTAQASIPSPPPLIAPSQPIAPVPILSNPKVHNRPKCSVGFAPDEDLISYDRARSPTPPRPSNVAHRNPVAAAPVSAPDHFDLTGVPDSDDGDDIAAASSGEGVDDFVVTESVSSLNHQLPPIPPPPAAVLPAVVSMDATTRSHDAALRLHLDPWCEAVNPHNQKTYFECAKAAVDIIQDAFDVKFPACLNSCSSVLGFYQIAFVEKNIKGIVACSLLGNFVSFLFHLKPPPYCCQSLLNEGTAFVSTGGDMEICIFHQAVRKVMTYVEGMFDVSGTTATWSEAVIYSPPVFTKRVKEVVNNNDKAQIWSSAYAKKYANAVDEFSSARRKLMCKGQYYDYALIVDRLVPNYKKQLNKHSEKRWAAYQKKQRVERLSKATIVHWVTQDELDQWDDKWLENASLRHWK